MNDVTTSTQKGSGTTTQEDRTPPQKYNRRQLSYANTFSNPFKATAIRAVEWMTGKWILLRLIRKFEKQGLVEGQAFWRRALNIMGIELKTPIEQIRNIPATGPVVIVANHPHGMVDGMILAELIGYVREDYKILTRSLLTPVKEIRQFMIPVPFPHEEDSFKKSLEMRREVMKVLADGGLIVLFPSGVVASSKTFFGPVEEAEWNPFTAKMILKSGATVVPVFFPGRNTRLYLIANLISATIRQGLLLHEVVKALNKPQAPVVGAPFDPDDIKSWSSNTSGFMAWMRERTLALGNKN